MHSLPWVHRQMKSLQRNVVQNFLLKQACLLQLLQGQLLQLLLQQGMGAEWKDVGAFVAMGASTDEIVAAQRDSVE